MYRARAAIGPAPCPRYLSIREPYKNVFHSPSPRSKKSWKGDRDRSPDPLVAYRFSSDESSSSEACPSFDILGGRLRRLIMIPTAAPTAMPTTSSPPPRAYAKVLSGPGAAGIDAVADWLPTATSWLPDCVKTYENVTVCVALAPIVSAWYGPLQTVAFAIGSPAPFVTVTVAVAVPDSGTRVLSTLAEANAVPVGTYR